MKKIWKAALTACVLTILFCALSFGAGAADEHDLSKNSNVIINSPGEYVLTGVSGPGLISVEGQNIRLTLSGVTIDRAGLGDTHPGIKIEDNSTVDLYIDGENTITQGSDDSNGAQPIDVGSNVTLNIYSKNHDDTRDVLNLDATNIGGCAIGNYCYYDSCDYTLNIHSGTINAVAGTSGEEGNVFYIRPGIGLGAYSDSDDTAKADINIFGGIVNASIDQNNDLCVGVGIGGSAESSVSISGGTVTATGGSSETKTGCGIGPYNGELFGGFTVTGGSIFTACMGSYILSSNQAATNGSEPVYPCRVTVPSPGGLHIETPQGQYGLSGAFPDDSGYLSVYLPASGVSASYTGTDGITLTGVATGPVAAGNSKLVFPFVVTDDGDTVTVDVTAEFSNNTLCSAAYDNDGKMLGTRLAAGSEASLSFEKASFSLLKIFLLDQHFAPVVSALELAY